MADSKVFGIHPTKQQGETAADEVKLPVLESNARRIPQVEIPLRSRLELFPKGLRVPAWSKSPRKNLLSTPKFLLFDLGVRHAAAGLEPSVAVARSNPGPLLEQWVGLELWRRLQYLGRGELSYLRTRDGAEIDFIVEHEGKLSPFEVKWTEKPTLSDARHLLTFLDENPKKAQHGWVICRCPRPLQLHEKITALPWFCL